MPKLSDPSQRGITPAVLRELLNYDPITGALTWRVNRPGRAKAGNEAGTAQKGRKTPIMVRIKGVTLSAARIIYAMQYDTWAPHPIRYLDGNPDNLKLDNLRLAIHLNGKRTSTMARHLRIVNAAAIRSFKTDTIAGPAWYEHLALKKKHIAIRDDPNESHTARELAARRVRSLNAELREILREKREYLRSEYPDLYPTDLHREPGRPKR